MALPKDAKLLGANVEALEMRASRAQTIVRLSPEGQRKLASLVTGASAETPAYSVYLGLENIRGDLDATVLAAYLNLPEDARPGDHRNLLAGSVGLYGLGRASVSGDENGGQGLTFFLDITRIVIDLIRTNSPNAEEIRVTIVSARPFPDSVTIVIGRVSIFSIPPK
jgi:tyrosinase